MSVAEALGFTTGLPLGLGCWQIGGAGAPVQTREEADRILQAAYTAGIRHYDSAQGYGNGRSEELLGGFLGAHPGCRIATKAHLSGSDKVSELVELSKARTGRNRIDLFYIHWPKTGADPRPMVEALERERSRGTIGYIGVSNFSVADMERAEEAGKIDVYQLGYNLLWRWPERDVIPYCSKHGIAVVTYSSLAQGILTGKIPRNPSFAPGDPRPKTVYYRNDVWPAVYDAVSRMKTVAEEAGRPLAELALRWLVNRPEVTAVLTGASKPDQIERNVRAFAGAVSSGTLEELDRISQEVHGEIPDCGNIFQFYP